jgi:hypothetical protein
MRKKILISLKSLREMERRRRKILDQLLVDAPLLMGGLSRVLRTCGKPTCHCTGTPSHPAWILATRTSPRPRCQVVRQDDLQTVQKRVEAYRSFRATLRELEAIQKRQKLLLRGLMKRRNVPYK